MSDNYVPDSKPYTRSGEVVADTLWPEGMHRIALGIEYKGTDYHGFQVQPNGVKTVQQALEKALSRIADEPISLVCAGRTDAGVHATNQVIHFDTLAVRPEKAWLRGTRPHLPDSVSVRWVKEVVPQFHARFSAHNRTYRYLLTDARTPSGLLHDQITWSSRPLTVELMRAAAAYLVGRHDFTSFRATQCQAKSPVRRIEYLHIARRGDLIVLEVQANAFLHHMVRNIVGVLMAVGAGDKPPEWVADVLAARDRSAGGVTAKPFGLYLVGVEYPAAFELPKASPGPLYFPEPLGGFAGRD
ncbi:tRNA pseudouridine(38-40) synthase TruA [Cellvibrio sp. PSBB023]|uniref:tRNA pseudouridine(38-40) synthase TruA n=1 Tax=Cellvibrio sp. PSBB023 TaxID=1945512 RepID=UPI00098FC2C7|nr:tRNA pseudouridine(38-40) synthase TruA [Cellvibrio sp. PSBB023]AQT59769.1 tRNA pseudouridine(38-40) synthase TruA [Cellvibrio sp. PSBB023]